MHGRFLKQCERRTKNLLYKCSGIPRVPVFVIKFTPSTPGAALVGLVLGGLLVITNRVLRAHVLPPRMKSTSTDDGPNAEITGAKLLTLLIISGDWWRDWP
jgi:hypothetical protein